jgi:alpha-1,3-mannosyl-glycoprotein beta-1,2-N-acetylglucosaminyltransferase
MYHTSLDIFLSLQDVVAAVVIMTYNRPDYLDRALKSVLKYHKAVADRFPLFVSQDGADWTVMSKARSFSQVNYMQHFDEGPPQTARPGEIIAYYKIASEISSTSS